MSENMTTSEPTTGEIVEVLRENGDVYFGETEITCDQIADRLESQEQLIERLFECDNGIDFGSKYYEGYDCGYQAGWQVGCDNAAMKQMIEALTARAEQAERERDAAIKALTEYEDALYPTVEDVMRDLNTL